jgi:hypothetical protein
MVLERTKNSKPGMTVLAVESSELLLCDYSSQNFLFPFDLSLVKTDERFNRPDLHTFFSEMLVNAGD